MENKIYLWDLYDYANETEKNKNMISKNPYYDLDKIKSQKMREEIAAFVYYRSTQIGSLRFYIDSRQFAKLCKFFEKRCKAESSLLDKPIDVWLKELKKWMIKNSMKLTEDNKDVSGKVYQTRTKLPRYFEMLLKYTNKDERPEIEKDIWVLDNLDISIRDDLIRKTKTLNFTKISQSEIKEKIKKGIYYNLQSEAIDCVKKELTALRRLSAFLRDKYPEVQRCEEISREIIEEYLIYLKTELGDKICLHSDLNRLRKILQVTGQVCEIPNLGNLFLNRDIPPVPKANTKLYSDNEIKRLNTKIISLEEQLARVLIVHQMLGTRISDTLLLQQDCLSFHNTQYFVEINQGKSHSKKYQKPISEELAALIQKAMEYTKEMYGETKYVFVNENKPDEPINYGTLRRKVLKIIYEEKILDDQGEYFGFHTHMFRHVYGCKLSDMNFDDWTISRLLGHNNLRNVKYYRKMSNQRLAEETRNVRDILSEMILKCIDKWEDEYEQVRQDACI